MCTARQLDWWRLESTADDHLTVDRDANVCRLGALTPSKEHAACTLPSAADQPLVDVHTQSMVLY